MNITRLNMSGGGDILFLGGNDSSPSKTAGDVTYYDYDGSVLHSYTAEAFTALTEHPALPKRDGLICQGWNWDLADAVDFVSKYGMLNIGAMYVTDNGKTRIHIYFERKKTISFDMSSGAWDIDWGDGSSDTNEGGGSRVITHEFDKGYYLIQIGGSYTLNKPLFTNTFDGIASFDVELGGNIQTLQDTFESSPIRFIALPSGIGLGNNSFSNSPFSNCYNLRHINIPKITSIASQCFSGNAALESISFPSTQINSAGILDGCPRLEKIIMRGLPSCERSGVTHAICATPEDSRISIVLRYCSSLREIRMGDPLFHAAYTYAFQGCKSLRHIKLPSNMSLIGSMFAGCVNMEYYDFTNFASVPTLETTNVFKDISSFCKMVVPDALYDEWIVATNWATYASRIIKKSEWDAQQTA